MRLAEALSGGDDDDRLALRDTVREATSGAMLSCIR
jgi:hypothetical protein